MKAKLIKIMKRGPDKVLSNDHWLSASFNPNKGPDCHKMIMARIWFRLKDGDSRYIAELDRESAEKLRDTLTDWLNRDESNWRK